MTPRPDTRLETTSLLIARLAEDIPTVRAHIQTEMNQCDSIGAVDPPTLTTRPAPLTGRCTEPRIPGEPLIPCNRQRPCGEHDTPVEWTPTERAGNTRTQWANELADIDARVRLLHSVSAELAQDCRRLLGTRTAQAPTECRDGGFGKQLSAELAADVSVCPAIPHKAGLCNAHYLRWWRERRDNGQPTHDMHGAA